MADTLLDVSKLRITSGESILVNDVSFSIQIGRVLGLVGESGSGKTLSALSIMGLLPSGVKLTGGTATWANEKGEHELYGMRPNELNAFRGNRISMIFQEPMTALNPSMRCGKQCMEPLLVHGGLSKKEAKQRIIHLFEEVKLPDPEKAWRSWPHELSGGQRQRIMIAMALSTDPDLLIADEPTTALDVTVQKSILDLLEKLQQKYSLSMLFISHDLSVIGSISDTIAVMKAGEIVEYGDKEKLLKHPQTNYLKGLLACKPSLETTVERLPTVSDFMEGSAGLKNSKKPRKLSIPGEPILQVSNLTVTYPGQGRVKSFTAVNGVSFDVYGNETLGLVGESGCGKTSLGRAILRLVAAGSGSIVYRGTALDQLPPRKLRAFRKNLQIVFQDPYSSLNPKQTIGQILAEPLQIHKLEQGKKAIHRRCLELLDQVGIPSTALHLYPHQFSGGQRQRIGIARALACRPDFIVLDESVSALDVSVQAQIINLLNDLKAMYGLTYIFISHDLTVVKYMSDRVMVMQHGNLVEINESEMIYKNPTSPYTRELIRSIPGS